MKMLVESRLQSKWGEYVMVAYGEEGDRYPHVVLHRNLEKLKLIGYRSGSTASA